METALTFARDLCAIVGLCWLTWQALELLGAVIAWRVKRQLASRLVEDPGVGKTHRQPNVAPGEGSTTRQAGRLV